MPCGKKRLYKPESISSDIPSAQRIRRTPFPKLKKVDDLKEKGGVGQKGGFVGKKKGLSVPSNLSPFFPFSLLEEPRCVQGKSGVMGNNTHWSRASLSHSLTRIHFIIPHPPFDNNHQSPNFIPVPHHHRRSQQQGDFTITDVLPFAASFPKIRSRH